MLPVFPDTWTEQVPSPIDRYEWPMLSSPSTTWEGTTVSTSLVYNRLIAPDAKVRAGHAMLPVEHLASLPRVGTFQVPAPRG